MRRYWLLAGVGLLAVGLAVGVALAAMGPGGFGGPPQGPRPGGGGPPERMGGPPPGGAQGPGPVGQGPGPGGQPPAPLGPPLIGRLEEAAGKPLTDEQRQQVLDACKTFHETVRAAHHALVGQVAQATGLTVEQVRSIMPPPPPPPGAREGNPPQPPPPGAQAGGTPPLEGQAPPQDGPRPPRRGPQPPQPPADK